MIDLSGNNISSLRGLQGHPYLADINMEDNQVGMVRYKQAELIRGRERVVLLGGEGEGRGEHFKGNSFVSSVASRQLTIIL